MAHQDGKAGGGFSPEPSQVSNIAPQAVASGYQIAIRRTGQAVEITLTSGSEYASIELYDSLVQSMKKGSLRLELRACKEITESVLCLGFPAVW